MNCEHNYKETGFCEWTGSDNKIKSQTVSECDKCGDFTESEVKIT
jgi:hypothetical protein